MSAAPTNFCALRAKDYNGNHPPHPVRRRSMRFVLSLICCVLTLGAALAHASDHPSLAPTTPVHDETPTYVFSMGVGGGRHADDGVVQLRPGLHIRLKIRTSAKMAGFLAWTAPRRCPSISLRLCT